MLSILAESNGPQIISLDLSQDSRKSVTESPHYHSIVAGKGNPLSIRREIETVYRTSRLECTSNTPLGDYPYLEQSDQSKRDSLLRKSYLDVAARPCCQKFAIGTEARAQIPGDIVIFPFI